MDNVLVFGCGREAERFIAAWSEIVKVEYCLDNFNGQTDRRFHGYKVFKPSKDSVRSGIVITPAYYYAEIKKQLEGYGLHENEDFWGVNEYIQHLESKGVIPKRKTKRVAFIGFAKNFDVSNNEFINILSGKYNVMIDNNSPEYVFCSMWGGYEYLKYEGIRIFYSGENFSPDFNHVDYAIGYNRDLHYEDRFFRELPFNGRRVGHDPISDLSTKTGFCNFIYSHERDDDMRRIFFEKLGKYKKIDSIGTYMNNMPDGFTVSRMDKIKNTRKYKFSIAFESVNMSGFITEKISDAFDAGTIPIYLGDPHVEEVFNKEAFINYNDFDSMSDVIQRIVDLDQDEKKYLDVLNRPVFNDEYDNIGVLNGMQSFLYHIFDQDYEKAFRRGFGPSKHTRGVLVRTADELMNSVRL